MRGQLQPALVGRAVGRGQLGATERVVGFEGRRALVRPEIHEGPGVVRALERVHLHRERPRTFEVRTGAEDARPRHLARVDELLELDVRVGLDASGRADGGDASGQVQAGKAVRHLAEDPLAHRIEEVVVHADQPRHDGAAGQVEPLGPRRRLRRNLSVGDEECLVLARRRAGAVDDAHVLEHQGLGIDLHERLQRRVDREQESDEHGRAL